MAGAVTQDEPVVAMDIVKEEQKTEEKADVTEENSRQNQIESLTRQLSDLRRKQEDLRIKRKEVEAAMVVGKAMAQHFRKVWDDKESHLSKLEKHVRSTEGRVKEIERRLERAKTDDVAPDEGQPNGRNRGKRSRSRSRSRSPVRKQRQDSPLRKLPDSLHHKVESLFLHALDSCLQVIPLPFNISNVNNEMRKKQSRWDIQRDTKLANFTEVCKVMEKKGYLTIRRDKESIYVVNSPRAPTVPPPKKVAKGGRYDRSRRGGSKEGKEDRASPARERFPSRERGSPIEV